MKLKKLGVLIVMVLGVGFLFVKEGRADSTEGFFYYLDSETAQQEWYEACTGADQGIAHLSTDPEVDYYIYSRTGSDKVRFSDCIQDCDTGEIRCNVIQLIKY